MLFSFRKLGACPDDIYLAHEFVPSGLQHNEFTGIDLGNYPSQAFQLGSVYGEGEADCNGGTVSLGSNPNNGISTTKLYASIAKQTGQTVKEISKEQSSGGLSAQKILLGLTALTKDYQGAADEAAKAANVFPSEAVRTRSSVSAAPPAIGGSGGRRSIS